MIEGCSPGFGHRLRMVGTATEHIRRGYDQNRFLAKSEEASVKVGQQGILAGLLDPAASSQLA